MGTKQILVSLRLKISSLVLIKIRVLFDTGLHRGVGGVNIVNIVNMFSLIWFLILNFFSPLEIIFTLFTYFTIYWYYSNFLCEYSVNIVNIIWEITHPLQHPLCNCLWQVRCAWAWILMDRQKFSKVDTGWTIEV